MATWLISMNGLGWQMNLLRVSLKSPVCHPDQVQSTRGGIYFNRVWVEKDSSQASPDRNDSFKVGS